MPMKSCQMRRNVEFMTMAGRKPSVVVVTWEASTPLWISLTCSLEQDMEEPEGTMGKERGKT